jgi:epsilon-lactone hydrolase
MPSEQFKRFKLQNPIGKGMPGMENMPSPGMRDKSGEVIIPTMPEGFKPVIPPVPEGFTGEEVKVNGIKGIRVSAPYVKKGQAFMHIHGGGFTVGSAVFGIPFMLYLVKMLQIECYSVEYSLAPKHKFPVQINECVAFYKGLIEKGYAKIIIGGESAGGNLSIAVTHYIKDNHLRLPAAVIALSPPGDLAFPVTKVYKHDFFIETASSIPEVYAGEADLTNPYLSPVYGDFKDFPPLLLQAGGNESLAAESVYLAEAAAKADVEVLLHIWKDMGHCFAQEFGNYPEADSAMQEIISFIKDKTGGFK